MNRFGILILQNRSWPDLRADVDWILERGFDSVWTADHFVNPLDASTDWFDGWSILGALAATTSEVNIGPLVSSMTLRNPAVLVRQAMTVDHISGGRLRLGVGAGQVPNDHTMTGVPRWPGPERADRFHEFVSIIRQLLDNRECTFSGTHYNLEGTSISPAPLSQPTIPLVVGAIGPRMVRIAAEYADVWNTIGGRGLAPAEALQQTTERVELFNEACVEFGRDPASVRRSMLAFSFYVDDQLWRSVDAFDDYVGTHRELGFDEVIFDMPPPEIRDDVARILERSEFFKSAV